MVKGGALVENENDFSVIERLSLPISHVFKATENRNHAESAVIDFVRLRSEVKKYRWKSMGSRAAVPRSCYSVLVTVRSREF